MVRAPVPKMLGQGVTTSFWKWMIPVAFTVCTTCEMPASAANRACVLRRRLRVARRSVPPISMAVPDIISRTAMTNRAITRAIPRWLRRRSRDFFPRDMTFTSESEVVERQVADRDLRLGHRAHQGRGRRVRDLRLNGDPDLLHAVEVVRRQHTAPRPELYRRVAAVVVAEPEAVGGYVVDEHDRCRGAVGAAELAAQRVVGDELAGAGEQPVAVQVAAQGEQRA